jgi:hypothetical protein
MKYAEDGMRANFSDSIALHKAFFEKNCTAQGCAKGWDEDASPDRWYSTDEPHFVSATTGEPCPENIAYSPFNYVGTYREELVRIKSLLRCTAAFAYLRCDTFVTHFKPCLTSSGVTLL